MKTQNSRLLILSILVSVILMACSGGETGTGFSSSDSMVSIGAITGFGSVYVNGAEYDTRNADIKVNGVTASEEDLSVGMVVAVTSASRKGNSGIADSINYNSEIKGVVTSVDGGLEVMGIQVAYDGQTVFESTYHDVAVIADITVGSVVEVSGYSSGDNSLYATRIELESKTYADGELSVRGKITDLNYSASTFNIGNLEIFFDQSTKIDKKIPNQQLVNDLYVRVKSETGFNQQDQLVASDIKQVFYINAAQGTKVEMEGLVTNPNVAVGEFVLNGITVTFDNSTEFKYGDSTNLIEGVKVEAEGTLVSPNQLAAQEISFRGDSKVVITSRVSSVNISGSLVEVLGVPITVNNFTVMKDDSEANLKKFALQDINYGDTLEIKAFEDINDASLVATMVKRLAINSNDDAVELKGVLQEVTEGQVLVSGFAVDTSNLEANTIPTDIGKTVAVTGTAAVDATQITAISF